MTESRVTGPPLPGRDEWRVPKVVRALVGQPLDVWLCGSRLVSYWTHPLLDKTCTEFVRSEFCIGKGCPYSHQAFPSRWAAFIDAVRATDKKPVVVMFTVEAARMLEMLIRAPEPLRGKRVELVRCTGSAKGLVAVRRLHNEYYPSLIPTFPVGPSLQALWRLPELPELLADYGDEPRGGAE